MPMLRDFNLPCFHCGRWVRYVYKTFYKGDLSYMCESCCVERGICLDCGQVKESLLDRHYIKTTGICLACMTDLPF